MLEAYVWVFVSVFLANVLPAFAPPTWMILSWFKIHNDSLDVFLLSLIGALASTSGRYVMYWYSSKSHRILPEKIRRNLHYLSKIIQEKEDHLKVFFASLLYALGPFPSNALFIASGLTGVLKLPLFAGFFLGRLISYSSLVFLSSEAFKVAKDVFGEWSYNLVDIFGLVGVLILFFIDWEKVYRRRKGTPEERN